MRTVVIEMSKRRLCHAKLARDLDGMKAQERDLRGIAPPSNSLDEGLVETGGVLGDCWEGSLVSFWALVCDGGCAGGGVVFGPSAQ